MEPGRPTRYTSIPIASVERLDSTAFDVVHSGYDTTLANQDPNRVVPLDAMRELEKEGAIGAVHEIVHATGELTLRWRMLRVSASRSQRG